MDSLEQRRWTWTFALFIPAIVALTACDNVESVPFECEPGESQGCVCADGSSGAQVCDDSGELWGLCRCEDGGADGDGDVDGDGDGDPVEPCAIDGNYRVEGNVLACHGCEWQGYSDVEFTFEQRGGQGFVTFDGVTHGPLEFADTDLCLIHGTDSWSADQYTQGDRAWSGVGTYDFAFEGSRVDGIYTWVVTEYDGDATVFSDCRVTYSVSGMLR